MTDGRWSAERVLSLATDASSARAARGLARPEAWTGTGASSRALWGHCRGSSPTPYQVAVDLTGPAYRCTCPSRKTPCKHALALLLLWPTPASTPHTPTSAPSAPMGEADGSSPESNQASPPNEAAQASQTDAANQGSAAAAANQASTADADDQAPAIEAADRVGPAGADNAGGGTADADGRGGPADADNARAGATDTDDRGGESGTGYGSGGEPGWVGAWLDERAARKEGADGAGAGGRGGRTAGRVADPEAAKARAERRAERVASGIAELRTWLGDRVRRGLGGFEQNGYSELNRLAARMVDAQAPGLAGALRRAASNVGRGHDWPGRLLEDLAMIHVTAQAHERLAELPRPLAESVRTRIGWTTETARVQAHGERVTDDWLVLGRVVELDERLTTRRVWVRGTRSGRTALLLTFAPAGQYLDPTPAAPGEHLTATLAFYPAAHPLRALITTPPDNPTTHLAAPSAPPHDPTSHSADSSASPHDNAGPTTDPAGRPDDPAAQTDGAADPSAPTDTRTEDVAPQAGPASSIVDRRDNGSVNTSAPSDMSAGGSVAAADVVAVGSDAAGVGAGGDAPMGGNRRLVEPRGVGIDQALQGFADVLGVDPWVERVAVVLADVRPGRYGDGWALVDGAGDAVEVSAYADPWPLLAVSAGGPVTVAGEWSRSGLVPMACWHGGRVVALT